MSVIESPIPHIEPAASDTKPSRFTESAKRYLILLLVLALIVIVRESETISESFSFQDRFQTFVTIFLSIFIEAAPFLLAGSIVSGLLEVFVDKNMMYRFIPKNPVSAALVGGSLGVIFPVCECGVVPVTRRLYQKGLPISMGIAFMLSAPVINPIVLASTYAAFGWGPVLWWRFGLTFVIASSIGLLFYFATARDILLPSQQSIINSSRSDHHHDHHHEKPGVIPRFFQSMSIAGDDFIDMSRYLIIGSMMAAGMQTLVSQPTLLALGGGAVTSIIAMMVLAFVLSVCSTVDAFLALAFVNTFPPSAIISFLVFGPMVDVKSSLMFLGIFNRRTVLYLILLPMMTTLVVTLYLNLNVSW